jgi:hypothetical protein
VTVSAARVRHSSADRRASVRSANRSDSARPLSGTAAIAQSGAATDRTGLPARAAVPAKSRDGLQPRVRLTVAIGELVGQCAMEKWSTAIDVAAASTDTSDAQFAKSAFGSLSLKLQDVN